jgi:hypothetical protein
MGRLIDEKYQKYTKTRSGGVYYDVMKPITALFLEALAVCSLSIAFALRAAPVKISFLDNEDALKQTTGFLATNGCDSDSVNLFRTVVYWNNKSPLGFDLKRFPNNENGFYSFQSVSNLADALPQPLINAAHPDQLNCFDCVILLAGNLIQTKLQPDSISGPFIVSVPPTNAFVSVMTIMETPRDAFNAEYPAWHIEASKAVFGESRQNKRICLTAAFNSYCFLPQATTHNNLKTSLMEVLQANWKRQGIVFPTNMEIVICHSAVLNESGGPLFAPFAWATHSGLLFQNNGQYVYIEKAGASGPYVRLDFTNKKDLFPWLKSVIVSTTVERDHLFATFNDREIVSLDDAGKR